MRRAIVMVHGNRAGVLTEVSPAEYYFEYDENYEGEAVSLTMPLNHKNMVTNLFHHFFFFFCLKV